MANPTAYAVSFTVNPETYRQDGYVQLGNDGYTQVSTIPINSLIKSFTHVSAGVWQCTLQECWPAPVVTNSSPLLAFRIDVVYTTAPGASKLSTIYLTDNIATNTTPGSGVINFMFANSSGTATDLPADSGFRFSIVLQNTNLYL